MKLQGWLYSNWHLFKIPACSASCPISTSFSKRPLCKPTFLESSSFSEIEPTYRELNLMLSWVIVATFFAHEGNCSVQNAGKLFSGKYYTQFPARKRIKLKYYFTHLKSLSEIQSFRLSNVYILSLESFASPQQLKKIRKQHLL